MAVGVLGLWVVVELYMEDGGVELVVVVVELYMEDGVLDFI